MTGKTLAAQIRAARCDRVGPHPVTANMLAYDRHTRSLHARHPMAPGSVCLGAFHVENKVDLDRLAAGICRLVRMRGLPGSRIRLQPWDVWR
jgi:hypothetical protein